MDELRRLIEAAKADVEFFRNEALRPTVTGGKKNYALTVDAAAAKIRLTALQDALRAVAKEAEVIAPAGFLG